LADASRGDSGAWERVRQGGPYGLTSDF